MSKLDLVLLFAGLNVVFGAVRVYQGHAQNKLARRKLEAWEDR